MSDITRCIIDTKYFLYIVDNNKCDMKLIEYSYVRFAQGNIGMRFNP